MKKLIIALALIVLSGCKTPCSSPGSPASIISNVVVNNWACTNGAQVNADIDAFLASKGMCTMTTGDRGIIANAVCPLLAAYLQTELANQVPASWGCNPAKVGANAVAAFTALCELAPF